MLHSRLFRRYGFVALSTTVTFLLSLTQAVSAQPLLQVTDAGILEVSQFNPNRMETVVPATVRVQADRPLRLEVLPAYLSYGPDRDPAGTQRTVTVRLGGRHVSSQGSDRTLEIPAGLTELEISIQVERPHQFTRGDYTYAFSLAVVQ